MSDKTNSEQNTTTTSWRDKTVKVAGYGYLIGDAAFAMSGWVKRKEGAAILQTGAIWAAGGIGAAVYGNPGTEKQLEILAHKLEAYLKKNGAVVTDDVRNNAQLLHGKNGLGAKLDRFMYEHPTELLNASYAIGAGNLLFKGAKALATKDGRIDAAIGALVLAGALGGLLIKEDPDAMAKADQSSITSRAAAWIKEKPMRFSSIFYWANNIFTIQNALNDKANHAIGGRLGLKPHWFSFLTAASYIAANGLLFASSRDQIKEKKFNAEDVAKLEDVAAQIIAAQPPQLQAALLTNVSEYLAKEKMVNVSASELSKQLLARVGEVSQQHLAQATWAARENAKVAAEPGRA